MGAKLIVVLGTVGAGKTRELLHRYHLASIGGKGRRGARVGGRLWLAPTARAAAAVRDAVIGREAACLAPGVTTFDGLARQIVLAARRRVRIISSAIERELLKRTVATARAAGRLAFHAAAAEQRGFIDLLAAHFAELRQRDISPLAYERIARGGQRPQQELAELYLRYDKTLAAHGLTDTAGIHALAREALASGNCQLFAHLDIVAIDGFTDFTPVEQLLLEQLANRAREMVVSLPLDIRPVRRELFAKTAATLAQLKRRFPKLEEVVLPPRPVASAAIAHIVEQVFSYPHPAPPAPVLAALSTVEIIAAASVHDEITQLARRVKHLLTSPPPQIGEPNKVPAVASDIVVVFRSITEIAARVEEVFARFGIPVSIEARPRLARSASYRALRSVLMLDLEDWPFRRLVAVLANRLLGALDEPARQAADWLIRDLQFASGRQALLDAVAAIAAQNERQSELSERQQRRVAAAVVALPALQRIAAALDRLPRAATPTAWIEALDALRTDLGVPPGSAPLDVRPEGDNGVDPDSLDASAWNSLVSRLASLERLDAWLGEPPRARDRRELLALVADIAAKEPLRKQHDDVGRVRVLSAQSARTETVRHLFLAGMSEQAFPASVPTGRLASENDYRFLTSAAHQRQPTKPQVDDLAPAASTHSQDEMLLFYEVIGRARETLTLSYAAMDDKAQPLPPSPYVVEVQRVFRNCEPQIPSAPPQLSPVPSVAAPGRGAHSQHGCNVYSLADWRIAATAAAAATDGDRRLLAGLLACDATKRLGQAIDAGIRSVHARAHGKTLGPLEGVLTGPAVAKRLGERFGQRHMWSPSQLETYAACPYKFFLNTVLGLEPLGDLVLETDFAQRGSLLHQVLAEFHRQYSESPSAWFAVRQDESRFEAELKHALDSAFAGVPQRGIEAALAELDRRQIDKWTDAYRDQHKKYDEAWKQLDERPRPTHFELRFGRKHAGEEGLEDPNSVDDSFRLDIGGETIHVAGRIDRIDVGRAGGKTVFNVIDYKSGKRPTLTGEKMESGERLQPALYVMAAQALVFGNEEATPLWAGYWSMKNGVTTDTRFSLRCAADSGEPAPEWEDLQPKVIARIAEIVHSARRGDFPVISSDEYCTSHCEFKTVCRIGQVRSVGKVWPPPAGDA